MANKILVLKAKHFIGTKFHSDTPCALENALAEKFKVENPREFLTRCRVGGDWYIHKEYTSKIFTEDKEKAKGLPEETVIRKIKLIYFGTTDPGVEYARVNA